MPDKEPEYKYEVPIETEGGVEKPTYEVGSVATVLHTEVGTTDYVYYTDEAVPHFHRDQTNVTVTELNDNGGE